MRTTKFGTMALAAGVLLALSLGGAPRSAAANEVDRVAAVVDGAAILMSEVERRSRQIAFDLRRQEGARLPSREQLIDRAVNELIMEQLQLRQAEERGIGVSDEEVQGTLDQIAAKYDLDLPAFKREVEAQGVPFEDFRTRIRNELIIERVRRQLVFSRIEITDEEIERFLALPDQKRGMATEYLVGHILIASPGEAGPAAARELAEDIVRRLGEGEDFGDLAQRHSASRRAAEGGLLDWRTADTLPSLFAEVIPAFEKGETSDVIEAPGGFHVVKLVDVRDSDQSVVRQTRAAHIFVATSELVSDQEARQRLERLRTRAQQGEDFGELAKFHSDEPSTAVRGGDTGWLNPGAAGPIYDQVLNALEKNEVSRPFKAGGGWHLFKLLERRNHDNTEEVRRTRARNALIERKAREALVDWLAQLREDAFVRIRLGEEG